ncbi:MAG TPA: hypothetical protein VLJ17_22600, partial [Xanthobacteraceae bacterium]|nr:hypothetical protein [Xanthobacteraceae bacterium]
AATTGTGTAATEATAAATTGTGTAAATEATAATAGTGTAAASEATAATGTAASTSGSAAINFDGSDSPAIVQKLDHILAAFQLCVKNLSLHVREGRHVALEGRRGAVAKAVFEGDR